MEEQKKKKQKEEEDFKAWKEMNKKNKEEVDEDPVDEALLDEDDDEYSDQEYPYEGKVYMKHWDESEKMWTILDPVDWTEVGLPDDEGGINFN